MSSIVFGGNTYTFGATVSANPGTGTTSYVFGGLSSGWTYGFIIWAFNGVGSSNIIGPITKTTLLTPPLESRDMISAFAWSYQDLPVFNEIAPSSGVTFNMVASSDNLLDTFAFPRFGDLGLESGYTAPNGSTLGTKVTLLSGLGGNLNQEFFFDRGVTYIFSVYVDLTNTNTLLEKPWQWTQISPGYGAPGNVYYTIPPGTTGWTRFEFAYNWPNDYRRTEIAIVRFGYGGPTPRSTIVYGPQMESVP